MSFSFRQTMITPATDTGALPFTVPDTLPPTSKWQRLLETIQTSAHEEAFDAIESEEEDPRDDPEFQKLW